MSKAINSDPQKPRSCVALFLGPVMAGRKTTALSSLAAEPGGEAQPQQDKGDAGYGE